MGGEILSYIVVNVARYTEILLDVTALLMTVIPPAYIEASPIPATTRPRIKMDEEGERAQMRDPASKQSKVRRRTDLMLK